MFGGGVNDRVGGSIGGDDTGVGDGVAKGSGGFEVDLLAAGDGNVLEKEGLVKGLERRRDETRRTRLLSVPRTAVELLLPR